MKQTDKTMQRYTHRTVWLHWLSAGLVIALWCLGQTIDWFPRGSGRVLARSTHISLGAVLGCVLLYRIWWRLTIDENVPAAGIGIAKALASSMHLFLYVGLVAAIVLGVANTWIRGDNLFDLFRIPAFDPNNKSLRATVEHYHAYSANLLLILAGLHALAGLVHQYVLRDGVLARMIPAIGRR